MTLKTDIIADLDNTFFNNDEFSDDLTLAPAGMEARTIKGIPTDPYESLNPATNEVETTAPTALVMSSDVVDIANHGDTITRGTTVYEIIGIQPGGTGTTLLSLSQDEAES